MKMKKVLALALSTAMIFSLVGCGGTTTSQATTDDTATEETTDEAVAEEDTEEVAEVDLSDIIPAETVTLNVYSQLANYEGEQIGWFAQMMLDKFNVKLNIISNGDGVFDTRMESGDLGDIILMGNDGEEYQRAVSNGMLLDWNEDDILADYGPYMAENYAAALQKNMDISGGTCYGFGYDVSSTEDGISVFDYHPDLRYDLYTAAGSPEINTLEDYIPALKAMKEICPTSDSGKETYGVSLFKDWDGNMVMFVKATATNFFGVDEFGFGFYEPETGNFIDCLQDGGYYERCLRFYNKLYQEGLVDPDSLTQGYQGTVEDYQDGDAFFCIFNWMGAASYNTTEHMADGKKMLAVAAKDQDTLVYGLNYKGGNRIWAIGANTQYPELCMAILDYISSPEGSLDMWYGPQDVCWAYNDDGTVDLTDFGLECQLGTKEEVEMPAPYSGLFFDGLPQWNNTTYCKNTEIPGAGGQTFNYLYWPKYLALEVDTCEQQWRDDMGTDSYEDYMATFDYSVSKANAYAEGTKTDELSTTWNQVAECIKNGSWQCIYADSDEEFDATLAQMKADAISYGYEECCDWCVTEAAARKAAEN